MISSPVQTILMLPCKFSRIQIQLIFMKVSWSVLSQIKHLKNTSLHLKLELLEVNLAQGPSVLMTSGFQLKFFSGILKSAIF